MLRNKLHVSNTQKRTLYTMSFSFMSSSPLETGTGLLERVINGRKETETDRRGGGGGGQTERRGVCVGVVGGGGNTENVSQKEYFYYHYYCFYILSTSSQHVQCGSDVSK